MYGPSRVYGLDIETDNSAGHGLNPGKSRITEIALATAQGGAVFNDDDELALLLNLEAALADLAPGLLATWNGSPFDVPFITDRLATYPVAHGWTTWPDPDLVPKYEPLPGHTGGYGASWSNRSGVTHAHLDISYAYRSVADRHGVSWSLKPVCAAEGIEMYELDRTRLQDYTPEQRKRYCLSDSSGTRILALRALGWDV